MSFKTLTVNLACIVVGLAVGMQYDSHEPGIHEVEDCSLLILTAPENPQDFTGYKAVLLAKDGKKITIPAGPSVAELFMSGGMVGQKNNNAQLLIKNN